MSSCNIKKVSLYINYVSYVIFSPSPKEPPPPPEPEASWEDIPSEVEHLTDENFKSFLKKKKNALVMFYAPCKYARPFIYKLSKQQGSS